MSHGPYVAWMLCRMDVMSPWTLCRMDIMLHGPYVAWMLCIWMLCRMDAMLHGRYVYGHYVDELYVTWTLCIWTLCRAAMSLTLTLTLWPPLSSGGPYCPVAGQPRSPRLGVVVVIARGGSDSFHGNTGSLILGPHAVVGLPPAFGLLGHLNQGECLYPRGEQILQVLGETEQEEILHNKFQGLRVASISCMSSLGAHPPSSDLLTSFCRRARVLA